MRYNLLAMLVCCVPSFVMAAEPPPSDIVLSLEDAQHIALEHHPEILSSGYRTEAAKQATEQARADYLPQVSGNAVGAFADDGTRLTATNGINNPSVDQRGSYGVSASQLITDFGRTGYKVDAALADADAKTARALSARDQVLFQVTRAYLNVLRAQKVVEVATATLKTRHALLEQVDSLRDAKMRSDLDVSYAQQNVSAANLLALQSRNDLDNEQAQLAQALGLNSHKPFVLEDASVVAAPADDLESLLQKAKDQNPELRAMKAELSAAHKQTKAEEAANYPTISALGYAGENPIHDSTQLDSNYAAGGIVLSIPLYTGGRLSATEKRADYQARAIEQDMMDKENQLSRDVRQVWNNTQTAYRNIDVTAELYKTSAQALELTQARYELGKNSIVDLAQAQLNATQSAISAATARYDYLIQQALLNYTVGNGA